MKVLAIGNSFSQDAARYLHQIAKADGFDLKVVNLFIGGCSLRRHYMNLLDDERAYTMEFNGQNTNFMVSIREALKSDEWDYVTMQQVSNQAMKLETYHPYLQVLSDYVKKYAPQAKQLLHQTWAYEEGSKRLCEELGYSAQQEMFAGLEATYRQAAGEIGADGIIPSGKAFQELIRVQSNPVHRDTFHASFGLGRYTLALTWYEYLTKNSVLGNSFREFDEPIDSELVPLAQQAAHQACQA